jgi:phage gpG-like protein
MEYFLEAFGFKEMQTRFTRMGMAAIDAEPAMVTILHRMMEIIDATFESQGRRGGGSWKHDTQEWLERKQRLGLDPRIGHATLALRNSLTKEGEPGGDHETGPNFARVGSFLPYAETQQYNRPFIKLMKSDRAELRDIVRRYLIAAWRTAV